MSQAEVAPEASLEGFLQRAVVRGERTASWLRIGICAFSLVNLWFVAGGLSEVLAGATKQSLMSALLILGVGYSIWVQRRLRRGQSMRWLVEGSVIVDALLVFGVVGASTFWPTEHYRSFVGIPHCAAFLITLAASGFRLSPRAVKISGALNGAGILTLLAWDWRHNPGSAATPIDDYAVYSVMLAAAWGIAWASDRRTRILVTEGAASALDAERARQRLGIYVSQEIAEVAMETEEIAPGGERRQIAVLFSDLRGFTRYSEKLPPERLVAELNAYLDAMVAVIRAEGGVVDKYIGDAIMVVFGVPEPRPDDAARAIRTAWKMQRALERHNLERAAQGLPALKQGIGVHCGEAVAGNIGSSDRLQYTVVGDVVNLASRLESATKKLGVPVLVSRDVRDAGGETGARLGLRSCGTVGVRGREERLEVFSFGEQRGAFA